MTVTAMVKKAMTLLGYLDGVGDPAEETVLTEKGVAAVNQICADLFYRGRTDELKPLRAADEIPLSGRLQQDVMPWGVAMLLAGSENDADSQAIFASLYNKKRVAVRWEDRVLDRLPKGETECIG